MCDLETGEPAGPGALGTIVATPFYPYRECMPLFRYDTRDLVRRLPDAPLTCEMANVPATSHILGKADHVLSTRSGAVMPRDLIEVLDALPGARWPMRYRTDVTDGLLRIELAAACAADNGPADIMRPPRRGGHRRDRRAHRCRGTPTAAVPLRLGRAQLRREGLVSAAQSVFFTLVTLGIALGVSLAGVAYFRLVTLPRPQSEPSTATTWSS